MQYHLDTIPVWEALEMETGCPFCALEEKMDSLEVERSLGGSVMEPSERIKVNETGICRLHHQKLFQMHNRLGHALLVDSHSKEVLKKLDGLESQADALYSGGLFRQASNGEGLVKALRALSSGCVLCQAIEGHMKRYACTFVYLWKTDSAFLEKWNASKGVCLPHAAELLEMAGEQLQGKKRSLFAHSLLARTKQNLAQEEKDLEWFTQKFDYRNQEKPWGNSKNALERTVARLRGGGAEKA